MSELAKRVCAVMDDVGAIGKDRENPHFKYWYVSAEAVRAKVQKSCVKHGLMLRLAYEREEVTPTTSVMKASCSVSTDGATWVLLGEGWGAGTDKGDKSPMKACTAAAKYALANAFCIALGDDPEADEATDAGDTRIVPSHGHDEARAHAQASSGMHVERDTPAPTKASPERELASGLVEHARANINDIDSLREWIGSNRAAVLALSTRAINWTLKRVCDHTLSVIEGMNADGFRDEWSKQ